MVKLSVVLVSIGKVGRCSQKVVELIACGTSRVGSTRIPARNRPFSASVENMAYAPQNPLDNPEVQEMLRNLTQSEQPEMGDWKNSTKALDTMLDVDEDGQGHPVPGDHVCKEGKFKVGKTMAMIYTEEKGYTEWVRKHIDTHSGREMQKLKLYITFHDAAKRNPLMKDQMRQAHQRCQMPITTCAKAQAKPKSMADSRVRPREEETGQENMEWQTVENVGRQLMITVMVDGVPIQHVNPTDFRWEKDEEAVVKEMAEMMHEVADALDWLPRP